MTDMAAETAPAPKPEDRAAQIAAAIAAQAQIPTSPDQLFARLAELGIATRTVDHDPVFTVEESRHLRGELPGAHIKNLFLRNRKEEMWLVTVEEERRIDLKALGQKLTGTTGGDAKLSFGSAERLMQYLGVVPGAVTPFAVINDKAGKVKMVLDRHLTEIDPVNAHPLVNYKSTAIAPADLVKFLEAEGHKPQILDLD
ncbi:Ala-tRNA(Pro) deacylase [Dongia mobilis]|uniref:Ala-tRNA(Pro) deacylase n=1 Tax=Dongia mobilis TaxID=578943 RepID=A0A4R6WST7_9PROT|nr:prolyl-tRNA synthetase associated domain-containing protein [Dongia mobilis]TDQ83078.1 Ala-tRNA(Pro) deacylase [Dongia mobilis]